MTAMYALEVLMFNKILQIVNIINICMTFRIMSDKLTKIGSKRGQ